MINIQTLPDKTRDRILALIASLGTHPSFSLPPVSVFIKKLKEILDEQNN